MQKQRSQWRVAKMTAAFDQAAKPAFPDVPPLEPTLTRCGCGKLICRLLWVMGEGGEPGHWKPCEPHSPVMGTVHLCEAAQVAA
jgi:hypothetical protein